MQLQSLSQFKTCFSQKWTEGSILQEWSLHLELDTNSIKFVVIFIQIISQIQPYLSCWQVSMQTTKMYQMSGDFYVFISLALLCGIQQYNTQYCNSVLHQRLPPPPVVEWGWVTCKLGMVPKSYIGKFKESKLHNASFTTKISLQSCG